MLGEIKGETALSFRHEAGAWSLRGRSRAWKDDTLPVPNSPLSLCSVLDSSRISIFGLRQFLLYSCKWLKQGGKKNLDTREKVQSYPECSSGKLDKCTHAHRDTGKAEGGKMERN